jgi:hypothetical protein
MQILLSLGFLKILTTTSCAWQLLKSDYSSIYDSKTLCMPVAEVCLYLKGVSNFLRARGSVKLN